MPEQDPASSVPDTERFVSCRRKGPIVTIDGPSGTGKSTLALLLAERFRWRYVDSGAMYRVVALWADEQGISWANEEALMHLAQELLFEFPLCAGTVHIRVNGRDMTSLIRNELASAGASQVARHHGLRQVLVQRQRELGEAGALVMDGRDVGTVVFPTADVKFYLDAALETRARRRWLELQKRRETTSQAEVISAMQRRDLADRTRPISPLQVPDGAYYIDTTNLSIDDVLARMVDKVKFFDISFHAAHPRQGTRCPKPH